MSTIGIGALKASYTVGTITWNKQNRNDVPVDQTYAAIDDEKTGFSVVQYNHNGDGKIHLSIHSGFGGVITNVHYTNGNFNNAKIHYNIAKGVGKGNAGYSVDFAQIHQQGKKGFAQQLPTMQQELANFLVSSQIDTSAINNMALKDQKYLSAQALVNKQQDWGKGRKNKRGGTTFVISG